MVGYWNWGILKIEDKDNLSNFGIYIITTGTTKIGLNVYQLSGFTISSANGTFVAGKDYFISFVNTGNGTAGTSGTSGKDGGGSSGTSGVGSSGTSGKDGAGSAGTSGVGSSGTSGKDGAGGTGSSGTSGKDGAGSSGTSGKDGAGSSGTSGIGSSGTSGSSGVSADSCVSYTAINPNNFARLLEYTDCQYNFVSDGVDGETSKTFCAIKGSVTYASTLILNGVCTGSSGTSGKDGSNWNIQKDSLPSVQINPNDTVQFVGGTLINLTSGSTTGTKTLTITNGIETGTTYGQLLLWSGNTWKHSNTLLASEYVSGGTISFYNGAMSSRIGFLDYWSNGDYYSSGSTLYLSLGEPSDGDGCQSFLYAYRDLSNFNCSIGLYINDGLSPTTTYPVIYGQNLEVGGPVKIYMPVIASSDGYVKIKGTGELYSDTTTAQWMSFTYVTKVYENIMRTTSYVNLGYYTSIGSPIKMSGSTSTVYYGLIKDYTDNNGYQSGTAITGSTNSLRLQYACGANAYDNEWIAITGGTGAGQVRKVTWTSNVPNYSVLVSPDWDIMPDNTSSYVIGNICTYGAPIPNNLNKIWFGRPELLTQETFVISGNYADNTSDKLLEDDNKMKYGYHWYKPKSYLVQANYIHTTNDVAGTGTTQTTNGATINVLIQGSSVISSDVRPTTITGNTEVNINTSNYDINRGESVEIACKSVATMSGAQLNQKDLKVSLIFVSSS